MKKNKKDILENFGARSAKIFQHNLGEVTIDTETPALELRNNNGVLLLIEYADSIKVNPNKVELTNEDLLAIKKYLELIDRAFIMIP